MNTEIYTWLATDDGFAFQLVIFGLLFLGGLGFPIPEDIPLLLGGVAAAHRIVPLHSMFLVCYAGVMIGDQMMFFFGHRYGHRLLNAGTNSTFFPLITSDKVDEIREGLRKRRLLYIFIGRHLFPIRSVTFITAGALRIPFFEFFIADALAGLVSVTLMMALGHWLGQSLQMETVEKMAHEANFFILLIVILGLLAFAGFWLYQRKRTKERILRESKREDNPTLESKI